MSKLREIRERRNMTQETLSERSGVSVRTIQRIESGSEPRGHSLERLAESLEVDPVELSGVVADQIEAGTDPTLVKIINILALPFAVFPPLNILAPLVLMFVKKAFDPVAKQLVSVQIVWTLFATLIFFGSAFARNAFGLPDDVVPFTLLFLVGSNVLLVLVNAYSLDRFGRLSIKLGFNLF